MSNGYSQSKEGIFSALTSVEKNDLIRLREIKSSISPSFNDSQWNVHETLLFARRQSLSKILYYARLYDMILEIPGVIIEFGVMWGASLALLSNLRGIKEPYNNSRTIHGFDTFRGLTGSSDKDQSADYSVKDASYAVSEEFPETLTEILDIHQRNSPVPHLSKYELVRGDLLETFPTWLKTHPERLVSMAIFDLDIYKPTKAALELVLPRMPKGAMLVFDELNCPVFPGETVAMLESMEINTTRLYRDPHMTYCAWCFIE